MPDAEFTATTDLSKWKMMSTEEIHEKFFKYASDNSMWVRDLYDVKDEDKEEALLSLAMIAGAAEFTSLLLSEGTDEVE